MVGQTKIEYQKLAAENKFFFFEKSEDSKKQKVKIE